VNGDGGEDIWYRWRERERERERENGDRDTMATVEKSDQRERECTMKEMM
jgi:hypothetical protein